MIDTADLQAFLGKIEGGAVAVDLLKIGQSAFHSGNGKPNKYNNNNAKFRLALDMEDCLDRFYGGYYSDWACGGQWNRAYQFVQLLANAFTLAHIDVIAFFDGTLKEHKKKSVEHRDYRQKTISVLKHIRMIGTPPPKIWWLPPSGIRTWLRNALRNMNIQIVQTVNDHSMEVISYFHENRLNGIVGIHPDYIIANSNRYFSSHDLRLSYKGSLETKEYLVTKLLSSLSLTPDHLPFVAVFLGGYILINEATLKSIYQKINVDFTSDFEARIKRIAEIVRNSPTNEIDEFIKHLNLAEWATEIRESVEYFQRKGKFANKNYLNVGGNKKSKHAIASTSAADIAKDNELTTVVATLASETSENDELAQKWLNNVNSLVNEDDIDVETEKSVSAVADAVAELAIAEDNSKKEVATNSKSVKPKVTRTPFQYTLPAEVIKTSLNRHQRGIMDPRIYQLLTRKEIILPQILEDEQYREVPSVHLFYRPARQMIYAIIFNMFHQKYLCSKREKDQKQSNGQSFSLPEIHISEWIWSPQNDYKKAELVRATLLPWAVPTIQRLWFGTIFEDKQRRMKAFLTVMRSDSPLMLNRGYVPQHMLAMACVLRYIVTNPDRAILSRQELDAFLATAFSPLIVNIDYTQELVLPGVHLRGIYLATLFMQGIETASLANDACGVPLPWTMTNPWLFFDGKLFHLKLKMSTYVQSLRELCDDHIEIVLKIERFRKAILEDVEHFLLPGPPHLDPYRATFLPTPTNLAPQYGKNTIHPIANIPLSNGTNYYNTHYDNAANLRASARGRRTNNNINNNANHIQQQLVRQINQRGGDGGYQLKVGGVVVGSWAGGVPNKSVGNSHLRFVACGNAGNNIANLIINRRRQNQSLANQVRLGRHHQTGGSGHIGGNGSVNRAISRNTYGVKANKNRNRRNRKDKKPITGTVTAAAASKQTDETVKKPVEKMVIKVKSGDDDSTTDDSVNDDNVKSEDGNGDASTSKTSDANIENTISLNASSEESTSTTIKNSTDETVVKSVNPKTASPTIISPNKTNGTTNGSTAGNKKKNKKINNKSTGSTKEGSDDADDNDDEDTADLIVNELTTTPITPTTSGTATNVVVPSPVDVAVNG